MQIQTQSLGIHHSFFAAKAILFEVNVVALFVFSLSNLTWGGAGGLISRKYGDKLFGDNFIQTDLSHVGAHSCWGGPRCPPTDPALIPGTGKAWLEWAHSSFSGGTALCVVVAPLLVAPLQHWLPRHSLSPRG